jgi:hypothetical protein
MNQTVFDVAIIGYGPAGATLANLLGQYGLSVLVLEREGEIYPLPRAIHFDGETMRVFETTGLRPQVETISRPGLKGMYFNNAAGETLLIRAGTQERGPHGCATNHYFHQPELEAVLRSGLQRYPQVQVLTQHEVTAIEDGADAATLQVTDLQTQLSFPVQARYVVGCDGARSLVRKVLGTRMRDLGLHQPWLVFDVRLKTNVPGLPDHTVQHCDPSRPMTYCNVSSPLKLGDIIQTTDPQAAMERDAKFKAGQPEIFQFPTPRLGPGIWQGEQAPVAQVFPQPTLANGHLLDTLLGLNFAVLGEDTVLAAVSEDTRERWQAQGVVTVPARDPEVKAWLDQQGVRAVLLRPDRYILGVAQSSAELDRISAVLPTAGALAHGC